MAKKKKKKNPADLTLRNVRAEIKRFEAHEKRIRSLEVWVETMTALLQRIVDSLEKVR